MAVHGAIRVYAGMYAHTCSVCIRLGSLGVCVSVRCRSWTPVQCAISADSNSVMIDVETDINMCFSNVVNTTVPYVCAGVHGLLIKHGISIIHVAAEAVHSPLSDFKSNCHIINLSCGHLIDFITGMIYLAGLSIVFGNRRWLFIHTPKGNRTQPYFTKLPFPQLLRNPRKTPRNLNKIK